MTRPLCIVLLAGALALAGACSDSSKPSGTDAGKADQRVDQQQATSDGSQNKDGPQGSTDGPRTPDSRSMTPDGSASLKICKFTCGSKADCPEQALDCVSGRCVECKTKADCPQGALECTPEGRCIQCKATSDCRAMNIPTTCNTETGMCRQCDDNTHCIFFGNKVGSGKCDKTVGLCVACEKNSSADCQVKNQQGVLWPATHCINDVCLECRNDGDCTGKELTGCKDGWCAACRKDSECCPAAKPNCGFSCDGAGRCSCDTAKQCSDTYERGQWACEAPN